MNICSVIVTFNRQALLSKVLEQFESLQSPPDSIVIIDNHSMDETPQIMEQWKHTTQYKKIILIRLEQNLGGSGGFYEGIKLALTLNPDWIWLSDDDAFPREDCFKIIRSGITQINKDEYSAICCSVINKGKIDDNHRRRLHKGFITLKEKNVPKNEYQNYEFLLDLFSYVGAIINVDKLKQAGLPDKDYFIWHDDFEHAWRLSYYGKIICLPQAKIDHDTTEDSVVTWKTYYGLRNKLLMFKRHHYISYLKQIYLLKKKIYLSTSLKKNPIYKKILIAAVTDAMNNKKGVHTLYRPSWSKKNS